MSSLNSEFRKLETFHRNSKESETTETIPQELKQLETFNRNSRNSETTNSIPQELNKKTNSLNFEPRGQRFLMGIPNLRVPEFKTFIQNQVVSRNSEFGSEFPEFRTQKTRDIPQELT